MASRNIFIDVGRTNPLRRPARWIERRLHLARLGVRAEVGEHALQGCLLGLELIRGDDGGALPEGLEQLVPHSQQRLHDVLLVGRQQQLAVALQPVLQVPAPRQSAMPASNQTGIAVPVSKPTSMPDLVLAQGLQQLLDTMQLF